MKKHLVNRPAALKRHMEQLNKLRDMPPLKAVDGSEVVAFRLADEFVAVLKEWLTPTEFILMKRRNRAQKDKGICHSHDFCDANMAMMEAWNRLRKAGYLRGYKPLSDPGVDMMNKAWNMAKPELTSKPRNTRRRTA